MKIQLLGTGSAVGTPAIFGRSRVDYNARKVGGRELRTRSGAIIDGTLKIDLPPETFVQMQRFGLSALDWSALAFTHTDDDHFAISELQYAMYPFTGKEFLEFPVFGNEVVAAKLAAKYPDWPIDIRVMRHFETYTANEFQITPLEANHNRTEPCQNLMIASTGKAFVYGTDTGIWPESTWEFLRNQRVDGIVLDCSHGKQKPEYWGHLNIHEFRSVIDRLRGQGTLSDASQVISTHHDPMGDLTYEELVREFEPDGITAGYDGLVITL